MASSGGSSIDSRTADTTCSARAIDCGSWTHVVGWDIQSPFVVAKGVCVLRART